MTDISPVFCDWLTAVAPMTSHNRFLRIMLDGEDTKPAQRAYHRSRCVQYYPSHIRHYYSPHEIELPSILVLDGEANNNLRLKYGDEGAMKVIAIIARSCHHFTRIDLSVDIMDDGSNARQLAYRVGLDDMHFGRREATTIQSSGKWGGTTTYIGARTSPKMLRIYDKHAESKGVIPATRVEFEIKAEAAEQVTSLMANYGGHLKASSLFAGLLGEFGDWRHFPDIENIQFGDVTVLDVHRRKRLADRKEWLTRQVLPTFVKDLEGEGGELWRWMCARIDEARLGA